MTDFSIPQRMGAGAFLVMLAKNLRRVFTFFIILLMLDFFKSEAEPDSLFRWLVSLGGCAALVLLLTCSDYFPTKFYVKDGNLIFRHGLIMRETSTIPLTRIHTLRTNRGLIYRLLGMRGVTFDTLATKSEDIELILSETDWRSLMDLIVQQESTNIKTTTEIETNPESDLKAQSVVSFNNDDLMLDALCQNHLKGATILLGFLAVVYDYVNDFIEDAAEKIADYATFYFENNSISPLAIVALLVVVYVIVLILWLGKVILQYYDMSVIIEKTLLTFKYGLISRSSCRFAFDKICTIWVKRNLLEKHFGLATVMLRQALYASANKEDDNLKLYGRDTSDSFLKWWLGDDYAASPVIITSKSGRGVLTHYILKGLAISSVAAAVLGYFQQYVWLIVPGLYFLLMLARGFGALCHSKITLKESYIIVEDGIFADVRNYLKYDNVEVVRISRTPLTRFFHRATISLSTSGTTFTVRSLKEEDARLIYEILLYKSEIKR